MKKRKLLTVFIITALSLLISGCPPPAVKKYPLQKLKPSKYPEFTDDLSYSGLAQSITQSLSYLRRVSPGKKFEFGGDTFEAAHIIRSLEHFLNFIQKNPSQRALNKFIKSYYLVYKSIGRDDKGEVLFTGYFEPLLYGSLQRSDVYRFPVYGPPADMSVVDLSLFSSKLKGKKIIGRVEGKTFVPYHNRREIEEKWILEGKAEPLAWVKDRVALFFLHIQGSGRIALDTGETINVHYNTKNGRPYRSIGQLLIDERKITTAEMSMQKICEYLRIHPEEIGKVLNHNPSYIFFSIEEDGPFGAISVKLTPRRSIAVDRRIFPLSALSYIETQKPIVDKAGNIREWTDSTRFVLNQDTGGAIKGPGRADVFWGHGKYAEIAAGHMKHKGQVYVLVLKPDV
ncbi:MAG: murein transglycosylase [Desulfobacteraceae bacterium]|nr:murein transglycosylase [Desulfobacteraceae bacterium]